MRSSVRPMLKRRAGWVAGGAHGRRCRPVRPDDAGHRRVSGATGVPLVDKSMRSEWVSGHIYCVFQGKCDLIILWPYSTLHENNSLTDGRRPMCDLQGFYSCSSTRGCATLRRTRDYITLDYSQYILLTFMSWLPFEITSG